MTSPATVCVIIAAKNASCTITRAIRSALREGRVAEVVVVDDGSTDNTAETSRAADDGSGRLRVLSLEMNKGPAFARNHAIAHSSAPLIAVLDADDFFLAGRFDRMLAENDWDFVADNIVFIDGRGQVFETPIHADVALIKALKADGKGNLVYRKTARNFGPIMAAAAKHTIVQVSEIVPTGALDPENVVTPGIYVNTVVRVPADAGSSEKVA